MYSETDDKARKNAKRELRKKTGKKKSPGRILFYTVSLLVIVGCLISVINDYIELEEKQEELLWLQQRAEQLEIENASYSSILSEEDERTYMERIAIEKLGYAYPEERRFYDTTRN